MRVFRISSKLILRKWTADYRIIKDRTEELKLKEEQPMVVNYFRSYQN